MRYIRAAAAALIVVALIAVAVVMIPAYRGNWQMQTYLEELVRRPETHTQPIDLVKARVLQRAAEIGLPVRPGQVDVRPSPGSVAIQVRYVVPVDLPLYSVKLHMRSAAGQ